MTWTQPLDPAGNLAVSALLAALPIFFICWALLVKKMKGYLASLLTLAVALAVALAVYRMPPGLAALSVLHGAMYGLFPICWIIVTAIFLYNLSVESGQFGIIKDFMAAITPDRRIQAILIAFSFGAFLEGTAGMGTPVAITSAMLAGLGFNPLYAAGICLVANTAPVAFGGIGIPVTVASQVSGLPEMALSKMIGRTLPFLSVMVPLYLVILMAGWKRTKEVLPAILVTGISFALLQWLSSNFISHMLPDVISSIGSIVFLLVLLRFWKPASVWRFAEEEAATVAAVRSHPAGVILRAWAPWLILTFIIVAWGLKPVKDLLDSFGLLRLEFPGLHNNILTGENGAVTLSQVYRFNYLTATGTAILITSVITVFLYRVSPRTTMRVLKETLIQIMYPVVTISSVLGFAYLANNSGMSITMAKALTATGVLFPFFSPLLGWLGVFLTGSDTSSNALFGKLQATTATGTGLDPVLTVAANASGGVTGKMISPQSIAVGAAAAGLTGKEADLFRFTIKHSIIFLLIISAITLLQAYAVKWMIPAYVNAEPGQAAIATDKSVALVYLVILAVSIAALIAAIIIADRRNTGNVKNA